MFVCYLDKNTLLFSMKFRVQTDPSPIIYSEVEIFEKSWKEEAQDFAVRNRSETLIIKNQKNLYQNLGKIPCISPNQKSQIIFS